VHDAAGPVASVYRRGSVSRSSHRTAKAVAAAPSASYDVGQVRRIVVLLLAMVALGPSVAEASTWYRCAHDDVIRAACCCSAPAQAPHHATPASGTSVRAACCCRISTIAARASSVRGAPPAVIQVTSAIAVTVTPEPPPAAAPTQITAIGHPSGPRGPPDPLFVRYCSLLL